MTTVHKYLGKAPIGWHFMADVGRHRTEGWRPTRRWAEAAARRWTKQARQQLQPGHEIAARPSARRSRSHADPRPWRR
ncbi:MAG: hypothetical protein HYX32_13145 [Actinobacteria bacterium]|nr:hypothetical protein [Actinomycetota bacterium]